MERAAKEKRYGKTKTDKETKKTEAEKSSDRYSFDDCSGYFIVNRIFAYAQYRQDDSDHADAGKRI